MSINGDQISGKAKQGMGKLTHNDKMKMEGRAQETKSDMKAKMHDLKDKAEDKLDDIQVS